MEKLLNKVKSGKKKKRKNLHHQRGFLWGGEMIEMHNIYPWSCIFSISDQNSVTWTRIRKEEWYGSGSALIAIMIRSHTPGICSLTIIMSSHYLNRIYIYVKIYLFINIIWCIQNENFRTDKPRMYTSAKMLVWSYIYNLNLSVKIWFQLNENYKRK